MEYTGLKFWSMIPEDQRICSICKRKLTPENTDVHHIDGKRFNNNPENLALVCKLCHRGHKLIKSKSPSVIISIRIPLKMLEQINTEAEDKQVSSSFIIRNAVNIYFKKKKVVRMTHVSHT